MAAVIENRAAQERVRWSDGDGAAHGIDDSGALRVETRNARVTLDAGEVHLLR